VRHGRIGLFRLHGLRRVVPERGVPVKRGHLTLAAIVGLLAACSRSEILFLDGADAASSDAASSGATPDASLGLDSQSPDAPIADAAGPDAPPPEADAADAGSPPGACNADTCPKGCCSADGTCVVSGQQNACGLFGVACVVCAPGDDCFGSGCGHWVTNCSPANCEGCCNGPGMCITTSALGAPWCGHGGEVCDRCAPGQGNGECVPLDGGGGRCSGITSCNTGNCIGCCNGNVCTTGDLNDQCGTTGEACRACAPPLQCTPYQTGGKCVDAGAACGPGSCPGCCDGVGCAYGNQDTACGGGGAACEDCTSIGLTCVANACQ
jgi:hypothetical protein